MIHCYQPPQYSDGQYWVSGQEEAIAQEKAKARFPGQKFTLEQGTRRFAVAFCYETSDTWT